MRALVVLLLVGVVVAQENEFEEHFEPTTLSPAELKALKARRVVEQLSDFSVNGDKKFAVYVGPANGLRRLLVQELDGGVPDGTPSDVGTLAGDIYDDNHVTHLKHEAKIWTPSPFPENETEAPVSAPPPKSKNASKGSSRNHKPGPVGPPVTGSDAPQRTGECSKSIFYITSPVTRRSRRTFTLFATTVSADQCARTCFEFNCAVAHFNPENGQCQFNPGTALKVKPGICPAWPNELFDNNISTKASIKIFCVQCQANKEIHSSSGGGVAHQKAGHSNGDFRKRSRNSRGNRKRRGGRRGSKRDQAARS